MYELSKTREAEALPLTTLSLEEVLEGYVQHLVSIGRSIKLVYAISKYDGILALKDFMSTFADNKLSIKIDEDKAEDFVLALLTKDLENFVVKVAALSTANSTLEAIITKHAVSNELNNIVKDVTGVDINKLRLNIEGKVRASIIAKYVVVSCDAILK